MAANYWDSTQAKFWTFTKAELLDLRKQLFEGSQHIHNKYPLPDRRLINIYIQQNLSKLARRIQLRQQALATAQVYIKRFYLRVEIRKTNPYLIMATAVYLACKMEECPQHIRLMLGEAARQWPELGVTETSKIGECEFALISTLSSRLIVHHPYRTLNELAPIFGLSNEEQTLAHNIINDSYNTDLCLLYPPHVIAITSIFLAVVLRPANQPAGLQSYASSSTSPHSSSPLQSPGFPNISGPSGSPATSANAAQSATFAAFSSLKQAGPKLSKLMDWLAESKVDMGYVVDATQEIVSLYQVWEDYEERKCKDGITKFMQGMKP
jgi:cyclin-C